MKKTSGVMLTVCLGLALSVPAFAATKSSKTPAATDASASTTIPVSSSTPAETTTAPAPAAAPAPTSSAPVSKENTPSETVKAGSLEISHAHLIASGDHIDVFLSIKNNGKGDERVIGGGSATWQVGDVVQVSKGADGKEKEEPAAIGIPAGKTTDLNKDTVWLRVKNVNTPKNAVVFPVTLYFRSSPNTEIKISFKSSGGIMDWFSK